MERKECTLEKENHLSSPIIFWFHVYLWDESWPRMNLNFQPKFRSTTSFYEIGMAQNHWRNMASKWLDNWTSNKRINGFRPTKTGGDAPAMPNKCKESEVDTLFQGKSSQNLGKTTPFWPPERITSESQLQTVNLDLDSLRKPSPKSVGFSHPTARKPRRSSLASMTPDLSTSNLRQHMENWRNRNKAFICAIVLPRSPKKKGFVVIPFSSLVAGIRRVWDSF